MSTKMKKALLIIITTGVAVLATFGLIYFGMSGRTAPKILFSQVQGVVALGGAPVAGAVVERAYVWGWNDTKDLDTTITNSAGAFQLPIMTNRSIFADVFPHEPSVDQIIHIQHDGRLYEAWVFNKRNYDLNGELNGRPLRMYCDLLVPPKRTDTGPHDQGFFGICELR